MDMIRPASLAVPASVASARAARALEVEHVCKRFEKFEALKDINLDVIQGEMLCFLGPSGCGKTTLLRIIAGLEAQTEGRIVQGGRDISWLPPAKRDYGIVFQSYALFPNLTASENVAYGLVSRKRPRTEIAARVEELLGLVGLPGSGTKYPGQLSGGQQQRIALARALATRPGLLLLDEPLSALDALERVRLRGEIRRLQQRLGVTTIMVTHDQEEALSMADRVVVMNHGVIEQIGTPSETYERPASRFVAEFLGKVNVLDATALGRGRFRCGRLKVASTDADCQRFGPGQRVRLYLRPEDHLIDGDSDGASNRVSALVKRVEFLGGHCLAEVHVSELDGQPVQLQLSLNQVYDLGIRDGARLQFSLRANRIRAFAAQ